MSNSPLVTYTRISPNKTSPRNHKIDTISIHCYVGQASVENAGDLFSKPSKQASCNYMIAYDGQVALIVDEKDRSWCTSSPSNDHRAITIECACDPYHPYAVNAKVWNTLIKLCADICKRNDIKELKWQGDKSLIGVIDRQNMTVHRWFANKACPGDYLYNRHGQIAAEVNALLKGEKPAEPEEIVDEEVDVIYRVKTAKHGWLGEITNYSDDPVNGYAGWENSSIVGVAMKVTKGSIKYRVHVLGEGWLGWITGYDINDMKEGWAGNNKVIDAIQIYYYTPDGMKLKEAVYKVNNFGWQHDTSTANGMDGYAGLYRTTMTKLQVAIKNCD